jgi:hypothetical protein
MDLRYVITTQQKEKTMTHITVSVNYKFSIKNFPIKIHEIFLIVARISAIAAKEVALALLNNIQSKILSAYSQKGYRRLGSTRRVLKGILGEIYLPIGRMRKGKGKIICPLLERVEIPSYRRLTDDSYETSLGLLPHVSYRRSVNESERINSGGGPSKSSLHRYLKRIVEKAQ